MLAIAAAVEVAVTDGTPAKRVQLLPMGEIKLRDGRGPFLLENKAHAEQVVAATRSYLGTTDFMFDYDHQALYGPKPGVGGTAIAAGWIKLGSLEAADDGIWGEVDWTTAAAAKLSAREYRYTSPAFMADPATKRVVHLKNAALVNIPAIDMAAVAAGALTGEHMTLGKIAVAAGLGDDATEDQILAAIADLNKPAQTAMATISAAVGLAATSTLEEITAAVADFKKAGEPDPKKFVSIDVLTTTTTRLNKLEGERHERLVAAAIKEGKLAPAQKQWGLDLIAANEQSWDAWYASAPVILPPGPNGPKKLVVAATTLTEDEVAACAMTGTSHEDFLKAKNAEIA